MYKPTKQISPLNQNISYVLAEMYVNKLFYIRVKAYPISESNKVCRIVQRNIKTRIVMFVSHYLAQLDQYILMRHTYKPKYIILVLSIF